METDNKITLFEEKIQEDYRVCLQKGIRRIAVHLSLQDWPLYKFNIAAIYKSICDNQMVPNGLKEKCADKLIDIKMMYCHLDTLMEHFYWGITLIVGNNQLEKLNPNTMSLLRENHYKVYLLAVIIENILDFFWMVFQKEIANFKRAKWDKILEATMKMNVIATINEDNVQVLLAFRNKYRTAELHKFSAVRAFTANNQWNHFQVEENLVRDILADITAYFTNLKT
jgi:hypothetical protein